MLPRTGVLIALLLAGIPAAGEAQETRKTYPREMITREEILDRSPDSKTAYDVIQRLRPHFFRTRSSGSIQRPTPVAIKVYVDGTLRGSILSLREILATAVISILYLDGSDATTRYGTDHENGAIVVRTGA